MATETFNIDLSHSSVSFSVRHMVIAKVHGRFARFSGAIALDEQTPSASSVNVTIEAASIDTNDEKRDGHLRSADFFDSDKFPQLTFVSSKVERPSGERFLVSGDLTIHGVTKPITLDVEYNGRGKDPWGGERASFSSKVSVNRRDFGLEWNQALEAGGVLVGDKIDITLEIEAVKA